MSSGIFNQFTGYHNRRSVRLKKYDYSTPGYYFVTICINDCRQNLFGDIMDRKLTSNDYAKIVADCWYDLAVHCSHIRLDEFVIMPNHVHGIINIRDYFVGAGLSRPVFNRRNNPIGRGIGHDDREIGRDNRAPTLGMMVAYFKYQSTKKINAIRNMGIGKIWQRNYYDHIIRNRISLFFIRKYIQENPLKWSIDSENHLCMEEKETEEHFSGQENSINDLMVK
jgi:putative transposase